MKYSPYPKKYVIILFLGFFSWSLLGQTETNKTGLEAFEKAQIKRSAEKKSPRYMKFAKESRLTKYN